MYTIRITGRAKASNQFIRSVATGTPGYTFIEEDGPENMAGMPEAILWGWTQGFSEYWMDADTMHQLVWAGYFTLSNARVGRWGKDQSLTMAVDKGYTWVMTKAYGGLPGEFLINNRKAIDERDFMLRVRALLDMHAQSLQERPSGWDVVPCYIQKGIDSRGYAFEAPLTKYAHLGVLKLGVYTNTRLVLGRENYKGIERRVQTYVRQGEKDLMQQDIRFEQNGVEYGIGEQFKEINMMLKNTIKSIQKQLGTPPCKR